MAKKDKSKSGKGKKSKKHEDNGQAQEAAVALAEQDEHDEKSAKKDRKKGKKDRAEENGKSDKVSVSFESSIPREEAVSYFETLVTGLKKGTLHLKQDSSEISLQPPAQLDVRVKASHKREKDKIEFEISWRTPNESGLTISSE
jgi:amphi-Trp domain-containing protein